VESNSRDVSDIERSEAARAIRWAAFVSYREDWFLARAFNGSWRR